MSFKRTGHNIDLYFRRADPVPPILFTNLTTVLASLLPLCVHFRWTQAVTSLVTHPGESLSVVGDVPVTCVCVCVCVRGNYNGGENETGAKGLRVGFVCVCV